ncbi:helix-turn-helix transcriptional regulator [Alloalcanivorax marinus]|uniref:helix-turn-helix transcriptional regulator n=1 Tax=Alloalcanivorax marinus TaxID=1177169 RepID=UPI0021D067FC|nr:YafY family protein [Alloalcanivorax marinus]
MTRLERFYRIHGLLRSARQPVPMRRFTEELGVTRNTITRDFEYLRDFFGAPISYDRDRNGHFYDPDAPEFELPGFWMNASELYALLACEHLLETVQPGLMAQRLAPIRQRIQKLLGDANEHDTRLGQKIRLLPVLQRPIDNPIFFGVADATLANTCLRFRYRARSHDGASDRTVHPQRLLHYRHNWYLLAYCEQAGELRLFSLDRIDTPQAADRSCRQIASESLDAFIGDSFGLFTGTPSRWAELRFSPHAARWVADELWHPDQQGEWRDDCFHLKVPYSDPTELIMEVLRHGPDVEVLGPRELRELVQQRLERALTGYVGK